MNTTCTCRRRCSVWEYNHESSFIDYAVLPVRNIICHMHGLGGIHSFRSRCHGLFSYSHYFSHWPEGKKNACHCRHKGCGKIMLHAGYTVLAAGPILSIQKSSQQADFALHDTWNIVSHILHHQSMVLDLLLLNYIAGNSAFIVPQLHVLMTTVYMRLATQLTFV